MQRYSNVPAIPSGYRLEQCKGSFTVRIPEFTANLVTNPSFEDGVIGYYGYGNISTGSYLPFNGTYFFHAEAGKGCISAYGATVGSQWPDPFVAPPYTPERSGVYYSIDLDQDVTYTGSYFVRSAGAVDDGNGGTINTQVPRESYIYWGKLDGGVVTNLIPKKPLKITNLWRRYEVTFTAPATGTYFLVLELGQDIELYDYRMVITDCWQIEQKQYATSYCDGSLTPTMTRGYSWGGGANESFSVREPSERSGGREWLLSDLGFWVERITGLGAAPQGTTGEDFALLSGGQYQRSRALVRDFTLVGTIAGHWYDWLHTIRPALLKAFSPDAVVPQQPLILTYQEYTGNGLTNSPILTIPCVYLSGLEGEFAARTGEKLALTFRMYDPYLYGFDSGVALDAYNSFEMNYIARRVNTTGNWNNIDTGANAAIYDIQHFDGTYAVGNFTSIGSPAVTTARVARWNGLQWLDVGNSLNAAVYTIAESPAGVKYVGGAFTADGAANTVRKVASLDTSTDTWTPLDNTELNNVNASGVRKIAFDRDGGLLIAGTWTGGTVGAGELGYYSNAGVWTGLAANAWTNGIIYDIAYDPTGTTPYVCGAFTTIGTPTDLAATTVNYVARYFNGAWEALGTGLNGTAYRLKFDAQGRLIVVGAFTTAGGNTCRRIARWDGNQWTEVCNGFNATADVLEVTNLGGIYVGGSFTADGDDENQLPSGLAFNGGGRWQPVDLSLGATGYATSISVQPTGNLWIGTDTAVVPATASRSETLTVKGTAPTYPTVQFLNNSGSTQRIFAINNWTSKLFLLIQSDILDGEVITVECGQTPRIYSDTRPNIGNVLLPSSNMAEFVLVNGDSNVTILAPDCTAVIHWTERYDGIEGMVS